MTTEIQAAPPYERDARPRPAQEAVAPAAKVPTVAVIVVAYNSAPHLPTLVEDLRAQVGELHLRVIVVDNDSTDSTVADVGATEDLLLVGAPGNLGYAGAINVGMSHIGDAGAIMVLNPDTRLAPDLVSSLLGRLGQDGVGVAVPRMLSGEGHLSPSVRFDPSLVRSLGDAVVGSRLRGRPAWLTETVWHEESYEHAHPVEWSTGACLLVRREVADEVGAWDECYFLYSEEVDFMRRVREAGWSVWFEPTAVVRHEGGGSGTSPELDALLAVNKVRYAERQRGRAYAGALQAISIAAAVARPHDPGSRRALHYLVSRRRWADLPSGWRHDAADDAADDTGAVAVDGCVLVPAHNEETVIARTLAPLVDLAASGEIELVVAANGCDDRTAELARSVPGATVLDLPAPGKPAALNSADAAATRWPRLYLDADVDISARAVRDVLATLQQGPVLAARPVARYDSGGATWPVRAFYRARQRLPETAGHLWGAGAYALSEAGHRRLSSFPELTADDLYVDSLFSPEEKVIVRTDPVTVRTPRDVPNLLKVLTRTFQGNSEVAASGLPGSHRSGTTTRTLRQLVRSATSPRRAADALVYAALVTTARGLGRRSRVPWKRDESTRGR